MGTVGSVHHVALTVTDLAASTAWYSELFGLQPLMEEEHGDDRAVVLADPPVGLFIGLHQHATSAGERFDEVRTGLDHLSLSVTSRDDLLAWQTRLAERDIPFSPVSDQPWGSVVVLRDPDNVQLELCAPPATH